MRQTGEPDDDACLPDIPDVRAEMEAAFARCKAAILANDVPTLNALFRFAPGTIRCGMAENLYGHDEIAAFRSTMPGRLGRQMQAWVRLPEGWQIVAAHVSLIDEA